MLRTNPYIAFVLAADRLEASGSDRLACWPLASLEWQIQRQVAARRMSAGEAEALYGRIDTIQSAQSARGGCGR